MNFDILSLPASPYIETMNLIDRKEEEYEMTGWYSDVWSELPVCRLYATENHKEAFLSHLFWKIRK